jgi:hypothetical protein
MRIATLLFLAADAAMASGPTASLFGALTEDRRVLQSGGAYGAEARVGWALIDAVALEASAGFTRSEPQSWLLHLSVGPKLALFSDALVSPYVRANAGVGAESPSDQMACPAAVGAPCPEQRFVGNWTVTAAGAAGADFQLVRGWSLSAELGWRRFFFDAGRSSRDVRGLWLGFSFR